MDFLGLRTLSIIKTCLENIKKSKHITLDENEIPLDDEETFKLFSRGDTTGLFQFESPGMKKHLRALQPNSLPFSFAPFTNSGLFLQPSMNWPFSLAIISNCFFPIGPYKDVFDFFERIDYKCVNKKTLENLIIAGGLDSFGFHRAQYIQPVDAVSTVLDTLVNFGQKNQKDSMNLQVSLFGGMEGYEVARPNIIFSTAASPTPLMAAIPKRMSPWILTVKSLSDSLTSGASTFSPMPIHRRL